MKAYEYRMVAYPMEIPYPKHLFFSRLRRFQQRMFKRICWILTSRDGTMKISYNRSLFVKLHCAPIEYEDGKDKPAYYLV